MQKKWGNVLTRKSRGARRANCPNALRQWVIETRTIVIILKTIPWLPSQGWLRQLKKQVKTRQKGLLGQYWWTYIGKSYDAQRNHEWQHDPLITVRTTVMNGSNNWTKHTNIKLKANCGKWNHEWQHDLLTTEPGMAVTIERNIPKSIIEANCGNKMN